MLDPEVSESKKKQQLNNNRQTNKEKNGPFSFTKVHNFLFSITTAAIG